LTDGTNSLTWAPSHGEGRDRHSSHFKSVIPLLNVKVSICGHYTTSQKVAGSILDVIGFFNLPNPSSRTMALGSTQPLTEISTRNLPGSKGRPERGADNLTTICEPIV
jgi:hypothetical protein